VITSPDALGNYYWIERRGEEIEIGDVLALGGDIFGVEHGMIGVKSREGWVWGLSFSTGQASCDPARCRLNLPSTTNLYIFQTSAFCVAVGEVR